MNYYNEFDPRAAAWLRELIAQGLIPKGTVDERSITNVRPEDLRGFTQCHFFAGIGGWPLALKLAGWPEDQPAWTGSCPCQPFAGCGKRLAFNDPRHLWPVWFELIKTGGLQSFLENRLQARLPWNGWTTYSTTWKTRTTPAGRLICALRVLDRRSGGKDFIGWQTPTTRDGKGQSGKGNRIKRGKNGKLHVANLCDQLVDIGRPDLVRSGEFRCWLMGYPEQWDVAGATAMQSCRNSRRSSSKP